MKNKYHEIWNENSYQEYLSNLVSMRNDQYRDFHKKLTPTKYEILGLAVPMSRKIAKEISKTDVLSFLIYPKDIYYEEVLIEGFVIASIKEENVFFEQLSRFLPKIDNWAICDGFCNSIQILKKDPSKHFTYFLSLLESEEPFTIRVGLITLLSFYIKKEYLDKIYKKLDTIKSDHYYVNMGIAWLLAEIYIKYKEETKMYFEKTKINNFTMNKTISKIRDSYRVTKEEKEELLKYKRKR